MNDDKTLETANFYAKARVGATPFCPIINGEFQDRFLPTLGGKRVLLTRHPDNGFTTREAALDGAREYKKVCEKYCERHQP